MRADAQRTVERSDVLARLDNVDDPELDRSIVDLEYVDDVSTDGGTVAVAFVLPTAWCSPAFAWMMATGIRDEVGALPGVDAVDVTLRDHMHGDEINRGVNQGRAFEDVFPDAEDGVDAVRRSLDRKARLARQYRAVETLLDAGLDPEQITALTAAAVELDDARAVVSVRDGALFVSVPADPLTAYLEKARTTDVVTCPDDPLFADPDGAPIDPDDFDAVHREARLARTNISSQGELCAQLHEARNGVDVGGE